MKLRRRAVVASFAALSMGLAAASAGCARKAPAAPEVIARTPSPSPPFESMTPEPAWVQRRAQRTWCGYLEALYHRATMDGSKWADRGRCDADEPTASPEMLERTADCSQQALDAFHGDPFSDGYAAEVKRCGVTVLDAMTLPDADAEPYATLVCARASACGADGDHCRGEGALQLRRRLGRALGALNAESRLAFGRCLQTTTCQEVGAQVSSCLEPILDHLLWTPR
jgi:hypothetical protein